MSVITNEMHPLLSYQVINLLRAKGIITITDFIRHDPELLSKITKLKFKSILVIRKHILNKNGADKRNALEFYDDLLRKTAIISTNHENLDAILTGFYTGYIYEVCSKSPQHLSRFINKFMIEFLTKHEGTQHIMYYDTTHTFNPLLSKLLCDIELQKHQRKDTELLDNLLIEQPRDIYELFDSLYELKDKLSRKEITMRIVVIDSLCAVLYSTIRIEKHNMLLNSLISVLRYLAEEFHLCIIVSNLLLINNKEGKYRGNGNGGVYGGKLWQSLPNIRFSIAPTEDPNKMEVKILKSCLGGTHFCHIVTN